MRLQAISAETAAIRRAEGALRASEVRFRTVVGALAEGVVLTDRDDVIEYVNPRPTAMTGYAADGLVGQVAHRLLLPPDEWPSVLVRLAARLRGTSDRVEVPLVRKDGTRC